MLGAAAVSCSSNAADLPLYGADAVRLAFRMGIHVQAVSHEIEARDLAATPDTWAYVVNGVNPGEAQTELDSMSAASATSSTGTIFISAVSRTSVTVSGPPSRLKGLFQKSKMFRDAISIPLPVFGGLCHAPHVYGSKDTAAIVQDAPLHSKLRKSPTPPRALHSTSTGRPYQADCATGVFEAVIEELLTQAIRWDNVVADLASTVQSIGATSAVTLGCFGNSIPLRDLENAVQQSQGSSIRICHTNYIASLFTAASHEELPRGTAQSKLAIVGMSCRLPGGATDTDKFWELLQRGLDVS